MITVTIDQRDYPDAPPWRVSNREFKKPLAAIQFVTGELADMSDLLEGESSTGETWIIKIEVKR